MLAFVVLVPAADRELAVDHLFRLGVSAVEERESDVDGRVELWTEVGDQPASVSDAATSLAAGWSWRSVEIDESVARSWREFAAPTWVTDDVVIVPSWLGDTAVAAGTAAVLAIAIDPGAAFGMGDHPTTQLTLRAMLDEVRLRERRPLRVLDVGCGSGVLAIGAALRGATSVVGIDISTAAVEATTSNSVANGVEHIVVASTISLAEVNATFDIVVANVLAPALIDMAEHLRRVVADGGVLVISGVLADRNAHVLDALEPLRPTSTVTMDGWAAISLSSPVH